jgi:hypothetical protein
MTCQKDSAAQPLLPNCSSADCSVLQTHWGSGVKLTIDSLEKKTGVVTIPLSEPVKPAKTFATLLLVFLVLLLGFAYLWAVSGEQPAASGPQERKYPEALQELAEKEKRAGRNVDEKTLWELKDAGACPACGKPLTRCAESFIQKEPPHLLITDLNKAMGNARFEANSNYIFWNVASQCGFPASSSLNNCVPIIRRRNISADNGQQAVWTTEIYPLSVAVFGNVTAHNNYDYFVSGSHPSSDSGYTPMTVNNFIFDSSTFCNARLGPILFKDCSFKNCRFEGTVFSGVSMDRCDFEGAFFGGVQFEYYSHISIGECSFFNAKGLTLEQIKQTANYKDGTLESNVRLPPDIQKALEEEKQAQDAKKEK